MHIKTFYPIGFVGAVTVTIDDEYVFFYQGTDDERLLCCRDIKDWKIGGPYYPSNIAKEKWFTADIYDFINKSIKL